MSRKKIPKISKSNSNHECIFQVESIHEGVAISELTRMGWLEIKILGRLTNVGQTLIKADSPTIARINHLKTRSPYWLKRLNRGNPIPHLA